MSQHYLRLALKPLHINCKSSPMRSCEEQMGAQSEFKVSTMIQPLQLLQLVNGNNHLSSVSMIIMPFLQVVYPTEESLHCVLTHVYLEYKINWQLQLRTLYKLYHVFIIHLSTLCSSYRTLRGRDQRKKCTLNVVKYTFQVKCTLLTTKSALTVQ